MPVEILGRLAKEGYWWPIQMVIQGSRKYIVDEKKVVGQRMGKIGVLMVRTAAVECYCHLVLKGKKKRKNCSI